jgi:hypothetical protein
MNGPSTSQNQQDIRELLEQALKEWHREDAPSSLDRAMPNLVRQVKTIWQSSGTPPVRRVINQLLLELLQTLAEVDADGAALLRRRYIDDAKGFAVANSLGISESAFYRRRRDTLQLLADIALSQEHEAWMSHAHKLESRLEPPTYHHLVGVMKLQARLSKLLDPQSELKLICLAGMGGLGKTAIADALARKVIAQGEFDEVTWISARQQQFALWGEIQEIDQPALTADQLIINLERQLNEMPSPPRPSSEILSDLKRRMARQRHLIIVDNLETVEDYREILPFLREFSQFAWILITSRISIREQPDIHLTNLTELSLTDAEVLIRDEASRRGIDDLAEASTETITRIYDVVGGNPLVLKLVIGQIQVRSLPQVLTDLKEARGRRVDALYEFIYRRAWDLLDDGSRRVLLVMPWLLRPAQAWITWPE